MTKKNQDAEEDVKPKKGKKKASKKEAAKTDQDNAPVAGIGHNGEKVPELMAKMEEALDIKKQIKALSDALGDISAFVKDRYNIPKKNWNYELQMRKLDKNVRIQFEATQVDLKIMLGYQLALDLHAGTIARTEEEYADPSNKITPDVIQRAG